MSAGSRQALRVGIVVLTATFVSEAGAALPRVTATAKPPLVAAAGDKIAVKATIAGTGKKVPVGLVFGTPAGSAKKGVKLGPGIKVSHRRSKQLTIPGKVPDGVETGKLGSLLVCVDPAAAVKGKTGLCKKAAAIATSGTSAEERIGGAEKAHRITHPQAVLYGLYALRGDPKLPKELRGNVGGPGGELQAVRDAAGGFDTLPLAIQQKVFPFFVPPQAGGSAWLTAGRNYDPASVTSRARVATAAATPDCTGYAALENGTGGAATPFPWQGVPTSDGKAIVWYGTTDNPQWEQAEADDHTAALNYANWLPEIWTKLTAEFGEPKSDAGEGCYHGPDGRFDVYVGDSIVLLAGRFDISALAITMPYPAVGNYPVPGKWCTDRPAWIAMKTGLTKWALAHELMHAIQFAHRYKSCDPPIAWWDEGGATWAANFVYPDDDYEQRKYPDLVREPLGIELDDKSYSAWPFWLMVQKTLGLDALRSMFSQLQGKNSLDAADAALTGGFAKQLPKFFLHVYNQSPVGDEGFDISEAFKAWDHWDITPDIPDSQLLTLNGQPTKIINLKMQSKGFPPLSVGAYHRVAIADDKIKELIFTNKLFGKQGAHVDAMLHLADGTWKLEDWTQKKTVTLCRDKDEENVENLVIVSTNTSKTQAQSSFTHTLRARTSCPHAYRITAATLSEVWTGQKDSFGLCPPFSGTQTNTATLGPQPFNTLLNSLVADGSGTLVGTLLANDQKSASSTLHGCELGVEPPIGCEASSTGTKSTSIGFTVKIPDKSPTAELWWFLNDPTVGIGDEAPSSPTCFVVPIGWTLEIDAPVRTKVVPRSVFESDTPQTISIDVDFDLTDPVGAQIHASEDYSLTIQRVNEDGTPLG